VELHLLSASRRTQLASLGIWTSVGLGVEASVELTKKIAARVREGPPAAGAGLVLLLDGAEDFNERGSMPDLDWLAGPGREHGVRLVVAVNNQAAPMIRQPWMTQVKNQLQGLLLNPDPTMDGLLLGVRLPPRKAGPMPPGRGYLVSRGSPELIQVGRDGG
jgi:S-DNA-T family DNA segregation ATPase FtsK/SpoIIIE